MPLGYPTIPQDPLATQQDNRAGAVGGPTPWWQLPGKGAALANLQQTAPPGYEYDPVKMGYSRTPTSQGSAVYQYNQAANPALQGLINSVAGAGLGFTGGAGGASGVGGFGSGSGLPAAGGFGATGTSGTGTSASGSPVQGGSYVPPISLPSQQAAAEAAFATAKDTSGKVARSAVDTLRGELGSTGNLGSGAEVQGVRDITGTAAGIEGQAGRDIAMKRADQAADFAKTGYQGSITQRGQDISAQEANARLALEQRQAESQRQLQLMTLALGGLKTAAGVTGYGGGPGVTGYGGGSTAY